MRVLFGSSLESDIRILLYSKTFKYIVIKWNKKWYMKNIREHTWKTVLFCLNHFIIQKSLLCFDIFVPIG